MEIIQILLIQRYDAYISISPDLHTKPQHIWAEKSQVSSRWQQRDPICLIHGYLNQNLFN